MRNNGLHIQSMKMYANITIKKVQEMEKSINFQTGLLENTSKY